MWWVHLQDRKASQTKIDTFTLLYGPKFHPQSLSALNMGDQVLDLYKTTGKNCSFVYFNF
jgi:hypothetical protein